MRRLLLLALVLGAACAEAGSGSEGMRSGMAGQVVLAPTCPGASPCPARAVAATVTIQWSGGERIQAVETDDRGLFRVFVPPGDYLVSARVPAEPDLVPQATSVTVKPNRIARVRVVIGTRLLEP